MKQKTNGQTPSSVPFPTSAVVDLGENPVNAFYARLYAKESSPSTLAVILELTENARDNGTNVTLTIDVESFEPYKGTFLLKPRRIICEDNGAGLTHSEFLSRFCGAFADSEAHFEIDRAGRNGVGTKTYTSIAESIVVKTTTARATEGLDEHRQKLFPGLPPGMNLPADGEPDVIWRAYEFRLHNRGALPDQWTHSDPLEMGTRVELSDLHEGTRVSYDALVERMSFAREWLQHGSNTFTLQVTGNAPPNLKKKMKIEPWSIPEKTFLTEARGKSTGSVTIFDPDAGKTTVIKPPAGLEAVLQFDFRVAGRDADGMIKSLQKPALLLEVCGALPYAPNLEGQQSSRTLPLLSFLGLENVSSIGAFCNVVCGWARINSLSLKQALRNNKTTLAMGPEAAEVLALRTYLHEVVYALHNAWYDATRQSGEDVTSDALKDAAAEVNLALKGINKSPYKGGEIIKSTPSDNSGVTPATPVKRHRWECGSCGRRWMAEASFTPTMCAEEDACLGQCGGCGSTNFGLSKNQPRIGDCEIRIEPLGSPKIPAAFQIEKAAEDLDLPIVRVNFLSPRFVELRGTDKNLSSQAQRRLKQYLIDVSLVAIAEHHARTRGTDFTEEWGELYFNRMLRFQGGIKQYQAVCAKLATDSTDVSEPAEADSTEQMEMTA